MTKTVTAQDIADLANVDRSEYATAFTTRDIEDFAARLAVYMRAADSAEDAATAMWKHESEVTAEALASTGHRGEDNRRLVGLFDQMVEALTGATYDALRARAA